ncbi:hypothetical protein BDV19DRAFT_354068 [Aspergillus venezuelensis]
MALRNPGVVCRCFYTVYCLCWMKPGFMYLSSDSSSVSAINPAVLPRIGSLIHDLHTSNTG